MSTLPPGYQDRLINLLKPHKDKLSYRDMAKAMGAKSDQDVQNLAQRVCKWFNYKLTSPIHEDAYRYITNLTKESDVKEYLEGGVESPSIEKRLTRLESSSIEERLTRLESLLC